MLKELSRLQLRDQLRGGRFGDGSGRGGVSRFSVCGRSGRFSSDRFSNSVEVVEILGWEEMIKIHWIWRIQVQMSLMCPQSINIICFWCSIFFKKRGTIMVLIFKCFFLCMRKQIYV